jgi:hypothetical protein
MARTTQQVMNDLRGPLLLPLHLHLHSHHVTLQLQVQRVVSTLLFQVAKISSSITLSLSSLDKSINNRANRDPAKCTRNAILKGSIPWSGCVQAGPSIASDDTITTSASSSGQAPSRRSLVPATDTAAWTLEGHHYKLRSRR